MAITAPNRVSHTYRMPFGKISIASDGTHVVRVALGDVKLSDIDGPDALTNACATQLIEYLSGKRSVFDVPTTLEGTPFQIEVWKAICDIPYSQTRTSAEIASAIGRPESYRMVGAAVRQNPLVILVPAHRVIPANGRTDPSDEHAKLRAAFRELEARNA